MKWEDHGEIITEDRRKAQLLKSLAHSRSHLTILLPDEPEPTSSTILDIDEQHETIILDEAVPRVNTEHLYGNLPVSIHSKLHGIPIQFNTTFEKLDLLEDGIICYVFHFPEELFYDQKRTSYRLSNGTHAVRISFSMGDECYSGRVADISPDGVKIRLRNAGDLKTGDVSPAFSLRLSEELTFTTAAKICHSSPGSGTFGVQFLSLNGAEKQEIQRWIMEIQRKRLRR